MTQLPIADMSLLPLILLVVSGNAYQPIEKRSWIKFKDVKTPEYGDIPMAENYNILNATIIELKEDPDMMATMIHKSTKELQRHIDSHIDSIEKRFKREAAANADYGFVRKPELRHQYGMLFNHHGQVISGLKNMDLFLSVDLPKIEDIAHVPPEFPDCDSWATPHKSKKHSTAYYSILGFGTDGKGPMAEFNDNTTHFLAEPLHIAVCNRYKLKYENLLRRIDVIKRNITYKIEKVMPRLVPNENAFTFRKETRSNNDRYKRAIPLGLIFSGVSAIGGLIMKGVNTWSNYKKSRAMTKAVEQLYEAQEIDHRRLTRLEGQTSLIAKTSKTAFQHIDYRLIHLDNKLNNTVKHMTEFFRRTENQFRFTWEALVSNRLAIQLLSRGSAMYDMVLRQYLNYYQNYDVTLDHFLTGLDALGTGRLTFQVLDPDELARFLAAIRLQLREERSPFELAFNHTYQFYAEPMVMFTNTHDQLLVNIPILLRLATQKPLNLYSIDTVPMPFDTDTLEGRNNEYTFINNSYPYMALNQHNYIPLTEPQLRMCDKMGSIYYCQDSYVLRQRTQHTCESAIYYKMDSRTITKHCKAKFAANVDFSPKVLDAGETMVLFNLPAPWILLCGRDKTPTEIEIATYKVVERKEFCECSLMAGSFQLDETLVKCTPEVFNNADGKFNSYFAINKIIFDYLQAERDVQLDRSVVQALSRLLTVKPEYDWTPLNWYVNPDLPDNVINQQPTAVVADLMGVMEHIITEGQEQAYQSEMEFRNAQSKFKEFVKNAEGWQKFEFISSILGMIALVALIAITIFRSRIVESIILGSAVMDEYKFVSPSAVKAFTLPPAYPDAVEFKPPTLPPDWGDEGAEGHQKAAATMSAWITVILVVIAILAILYTIFKKCRYVSSLPRVCFPLYPFNTILRGTARTDIFVEVVNLASAEAMWAHFATVAVHPSQLRITGYPTAYNMNIIKLCCCKQLQVDWQNIILCDLDRNVIKLPALGQISIWTTNDLSTIESNVPYQTRVYGRVLDLITPLEIKDDVQILDHRLY